MSDSDTEEELIVEKGGEEEGAVHKRRADMWQEVMSRQAGETKKPEAGRISEGTREVSKEKADQLLLVVGPKERPRAQQRNSQREVRKGEVHPYRSSTSESGLGKRRKLTENQNSAKRTLTRLKAHDGNHLEKLLDNLSPDQLQFDSELLLGAYNECDGDNERGKRL
jgi:hypothetical protein